LVKGEGKIARKRGEHLRKTRRQHHGEDPSIQPGVHRGEPIACDGTLKCPGLRVPKKKRGRISTKERQRSQHLYRRQDGRDNR